MSQAKDLAAIVRRVVSGWQGQAGRACSSYAGSAKVTLRNFSLTHTHSFPRPQPRGRANADLTAPTPQNTPLNNAPLTREALSRPTVGTVEEEEEAEEAGGASAQNASVAAALAANPALASLIQGKLNTLVGRSSGYLESLPDYQRRRVEGLRGLEAQHLQIEAEFQREILELEKKYAQRYQPLYERRAKIVAGEVEPTAEEVKEGEEHKAEGQDDEEDEEEEDEKKESLAAVSAPSDGVKGLPEFWLTALKNHVALNELITERDEEALKHLVDVRMKHLPSGQMGFQLSFHFDASKNPCFTDDVLTKTYFYQDEVKSGGDLIYDHAEGSTIHWKEDKDLTHVIETKKQRNKNTNQTRTVKRSVPVESFFNFFTPPKAPGSNEDEDEEEDDEAMQELEERLELDYQIGEDLKDRVIPHAITYFTGEALLHDDDFADDFEDEDDFEDDDEDDEDDDEEDDDNKRARRLGASAGSQMAGSQDPEKCQQQ